MIEIRDKLHLNLFTSDNYQNERQTEEEAWMEKKKYIKSMCVSLLPFEEIKNVLKVFSFFPHEALNSRHEEFSFFSVGARFLQVNTEATQTNEHRRLYKCEVAVIGRITFGFSCTSISAVDGKRKHVWKNRSNKWENFLTRTWKESNLDFLQNSWNLF